MTKSVRVMVVDDTDHVREMLASMLTIDGFEIVGQARSGQQALELMPQVSADVVVLDYSMPDMDGIVTTRKIKNLRPDQPVIIYTAFLDDEVKRAAREAGASICIGKIEGLDILERSICEVCAPIGFGY